MAKKKPTKVFTFKDLNEKINESFHPFTELLQELAEAFHPVLEQLNNLASQIPPELRVKSRLFSDHWPVNDSELIEHISKNKDATIKLSQVICQFYSEGDWNRLEAMIDRWDQAGIINDRISIIRDCFNVLRMVTRSNENINAANVLIPTLICHLEGIIKDYGLIEITKPPGKTNVSKIPLDRIYLSHAPMFQIYGYVFRNSHEFDKEKKEGGDLLNINRHKINHGDAILLDYGTEENLVRLFLYIDMTIYFIIKEDLHKENDQ